jgi:multidrug efflux pump subunit AcrB
VGSSLTSETLPLTKVSDYASSILAQKISQMPGVGEVDVGGQQNPAIRQDVNLAGWMNTEPAIIIAVQRHPGANVIATVDQLKKALPQLEASLPPSIKIHIVSDRTQRLCHGNGRGIEGGMG